MLLGVRKAVRVIDLGDVDMGVGEVFLSRRDCPFDLIPVGILFVVVVEHTNTENNRFGCYLGLARRENCIVVEIYKFSPRVGMELDRIHWIWWRC